MKRLSFVVALSLMSIVAACNSDSESPTAGTGGPATAVPMFTFSLTTANEVPPVTNAEAGGSGSVTIKFNLTRNATNAITAATVDFTATLTGFPASTNITMAHIHEAAAGVNGPIRVNTNLVSGEVPLVGGAGTFTKNAVVVTDLSIIQRILDTPSAFYFNVHSTLNPSGVVRAQLARAQ